MSGHGDIVRFAESVVGQPHQQFVWTPHGLELAQAVLALVRERDERWPCGCAYGVAHGAGWRDCPLSPFAALLQAAEAERDEALAETERFRQRASGIWNFLGPEGQDALIESGWHP